MVRVRVRVRGAKPRVREIGEVWGMGLVTGRSRGTDSNVIY